MKIFGITITTIAAFLAHQAMADDTIIDIQWEDYRHLKIEEVLSDVITKCGMCFERLIYLSQSTNPLCTVILPEKGIYALSVNNPSACVLLVTDEGYVCYLKASNLSMAC